MHSGSVDGATFTGQHAHIPITHRGGEGRGPASGGGALSNSPALLPMTPTGPGSIGPLSIATALKTNTSTVLLSVFSHDLPPPIFPFPHHLLGPRKGWRVGGVLLSLSDSCRLPWSHLQSECTMISLTSPWGSECSVDMKHKAQLNINSNWTRTDITITMAMGLGDQSCDHQVLFLGKEIGGGGCLQAIVRGGHGQVPTQVQ